MDAASAAVTRTVPTGNLKVGGFKLFSVVIAVPVLPVQAVVRSSSCDSDPWVSLLITGTVTRTFRWRAQSVKSCTQAGRGMSVIGRLDILHDFTNLKVPASGTIASAN